MDGTSTTEPRGAYLVMLRALMGDGPEAPIAPTEFSRLTGISLDSIRSIESGRRPLSDTVQRKIKLSISAVWDHPTDRWVWAYDRAVPFSRDVYRTFASRIVLNAYQMDLDAHAVLLRVLGLLREADQERYHALIFSVHESLADLEREFGNERTRKVFDATEISIGIGRDVADGELGFVSREYPRLFDTAGGKLVEDARDIPGRPGQPVLPRRDFMLDFRELRRADHYSPPSPRRKYQEFDAELATQPFEPQTAPRSLRKKAARSSKPGPVPEAPLRNNGPT
jgi:hypothetical protein